MTKQEPILELYEVTVELDHEVILENISMQIFSGDTIVLIGPSGAGKTVLMKTMAGLFEPSHGEVTCYGHSWQNLSLVEKHDLSQKVGMQFQKHALFDSLDAFDNIAFPIREHNLLNETELPQRVMECLKAVSLDKAVHLQVHEMSGGMKQRLGIARAISMKPEILFLDDPTAGLDPVNSDNMAELILKLKKEINATLIVVTHDMQRAYQFAGRIFLVVDQSIIETGGVKDTKNHPDPRVQQFIHGKQQGPITNTGV